MKLRAAVVALALLGAAPGAEPDSEDIVVQSVTEEWTIGLCPCTWGIVTVMTAILAGGLGYAVMKRNHTKPV